MNITIPKPTPAYDFDALCDKAAAEIAKELERRKSLGYSHLGAGINTEHCYGGGYPMRVVEHVGREFAKAGWYVYLVRGGAYNNWTWLKVANYEHAEGYTNANIPDYYKKI